MNAVEDMMDDMQDMMADQEEIQEMMGRNFECEFDENDLLDELAELDEEIIGDQLNEGLGLPSYIPQGNKAKEGEAAEANKAPNEAEALENMM